MCSADRQPTPVLFVSHAFEDARTGPAVYARYLWRRFADDPRFEFHVIAPDGPAGHPRFHVARPSRPGARAFYQGLMRTALSLAARIGRPGILHLNAPHYDLIRPPTGWRLVLQLNDYEGAGLFAAPWANLRANGWRRFAALVVRRWVERRMLGRCDLALANSDFTRREVLAAYPELAPGKLRTLYKSVDTDFFRGQRAARTAGCRFAFVGTNFRLKQLHLAVEAFSMLGDLGGSLQIAGCTQREFVDAHPSLAAASSPGLRFLGKMDRAGVRDLLLKSDVLLLPSRVEALGVAALEALACGCRVIGANVGGIPEIISSPEVGLLVQEPTPAAWADAMRRISGDPALGVEVAERTLANFTTQSMLRQLEAIYLSINV